MDVQSAATAVSARMATAPPVASAPKANNAASAMAAATTAQPMAAAAPWWRPGSRNRRGEPVTARSATAVTTPR
ncbi:hypothetical protein [Comamonas sp. JC664]|uniref:hypothetical protein n=1 Tax=Comamonas sp. JC664 TaxID=2801917 RepID=UPI00361B3863